MTAKKAIGVEFNYSNWGLGYPSKKVQDENFFTVVINCTDEKTCQWESRLNFDSDKTGVMCEANLISNYTISESSQKRKAQVKDLVEIPERLKTTNYRSILQNGISTSGAYQQSEIDGDTLPTKSPGGDGCRPKVVLLTVLFLTLSIFAFLQ